MNKKIMFLAPCFLLLAPCFPAEAQPQTRIPKVGWLGVRPISDPGGGYEILRQELRALGYVEGKNIVFEYRSADNKLERLPGLADELVRLKVDVIVAPAGNEAVAAKNATKTIPIVFFGGGDPVAAGLVDSLARPGGNVTGLTRLTRELSGKRLELLTETIPGISRIAVLWSATLGTETFNDYGAAARALKIQLQSLEVRGPHPDLEGAFRDAVKGRASAIITGRSTALIPYPKKIADLALKNRLPSMFEDTEYVAVGGLMSYSANDADQFRRAATYVDKILKGTKPPIYRSSNRRSLNSSSTSKPPSRSVLRFRRTCWCGRIK